MSHPAVRGALATLLALGSTLAMAQAWPSKPIRMIVPYTPGGYTDNMARGVGEPLGRALGTTVIFENRPGANSILGAEMLANEGGDSLTDTTSFATM